MKKLMTQAWVSYWRARRFLVDHGVADRPRFEQFRSRFYENLWKKTAQKIGADIEDVGYGFYKISLNGHCTYVLESKVALDNHLSLRMAGNKPLMHRMLSEQNYPVQDYCEYTVHSLRKAGDFIRKIAQSAVVKPAAGTGAGNGITTKIRTFAQLKKASWWAATFNSRLLIEEEVAGASYRLLYLDGRYLDAVKRHSPHITGDGRRSVKALIAAENQERLTADPFLSLSPLIIDYECQRTLAEQGCRLKDVLAAGQSIPVKTVVNQNRIIENQSVREAVHPEIIEMGANIARLFKLKLIGVDLITPDITRPLAAVQGVINEINTDPGLHHHYLIDSPEKVMPVAEHILEYIFEKTTAGSPV